MEKAERGASGLARNAQRATRNAPSFGWLTSETETGIVFPHRTLHVLRDKVCLVRLRWKPASVDVRHACPPSGWSGALLGLFSFFHRCS